MRRIDRRALLVLVGGLSAACGTAHHEGASAQRPPTTAEAKSALNAVGPIDPNDGFPLYYEDTAGVRLAQCNDTTDPICVQLLGATPEFSLALPTQFAANFPDEFFYAYSASDKVATPGCAANPANPGSTPPGLPTAATNPGKAFTLSGVEGAFANGLAVPGDQMSFGRIRIVASGLCPFTQYDFQHAYGIERVKTNGLGQVTANIKGFTEDIGCFAMPCNFSLPFSAPIPGPPPSTGSRVFNGFAKWDPAESAPPPGYLGTPGTLHSIIGTPNVEFIVWNATAGSPKGSGAVITDVTGAIPARTTRWAVSGKLAGDLTAPSLGFGAQAMGVLSAPRTVTVTNWSQAVMTVNALAISGVNAADYAITANTCVGTALARDATCTITATFNPAALGASTAKIDVAATRPDAIAPIPLSIPLGGTGIVPGAVANASFSTATLNYANVRVNAYSNPQTVTLTNTGAAPMEVLGVAKVGLAAAEYTVLQDTCAGRFIDPGMSCFVSVKVRPSAVGVRDASLSFTDDAPGSPHTVALTVTGVGGLNAVAATVDANGYPSWYRDDNGVQVTPCYDQIPDTTPGALPGALLVDPFCLLPPTIETDANGVQLWDPSLPLASFGNFPTEAFYYAATNTLLDLPGCPADGIAAGGKSVLLSGLESTFVTGTPIAGDQITFGRTRYFTKGLCKNTDYVFTSPYGVATLKSDANGAVAANRKVDIGCLAAPCNFSDALADPVFDGMLRWTQGTGILGDEIAPPGYLGDPLTPHRVTGGTYKIGGVPVDYYEIKRADTGVVVAGGPSANLWNVVGKTAVVSGLPSTIAFPARSVGGTGPVQTVTLTNVDPVNAVTLTSVVLGGINPGDYALTNNTCIAPLTPCNNQPLHENAGPAYLPLQLACPATSSCTVDVSFSPLAVGVSEAAVIGNHTNASHTAMQVLVTGLGGTPGLSFTPGGGVVFDDQPQLSDSYPHDIDVHNTGNAPLIIPAGAVTITGANATEFELTADGCSGTTVATGSFCTINVTFSPAILGALAGTLNVNSNAPGAPHAIPLTGKSLLPAAGVALMSDIAAFDPLLWGNVSATKSGTITNIGGGVLSIHHIGIVGQNTDAFLLTKGTCTDGLALAPAAICTYTVAFTPGPLGIFNAAGSGARAASVYAYDTDGNTALATKPVSGTAIKPVVAPVSTNIGGAAGVNTGATLSSTINVTNSGSGNLIVPAAGLAIAGSPYYTITGNTCTAGPVAPAGVCTVTVAFSPILAGVANATLNVTSNTSLPDAATAFPLTGTSNAPALNFQGGSTLAFSATRVGTTTSKGVNLLNTGNLPLHVGTLTTPPGSEYSLPASANKCNNAVVAPGKSCSFNVTFAPLAPVGAHPDVILTATSTTIAGSWADPRGAQTLTLQGSAK